MGPRSAATRMLVGTGLTDLTFRTSQVALPLVVLSSTGSAAATGLVGGASGIPVLLSPWWTRRLRQRIRTGRAIAGCYLVEALALSTVALGATLGRVDALLLGCAGLVLGSAEAVDGPARDALTADLGDRMGVDRALTLLTAREFFRRVSMVVGPAAGGLLVARGLAVPLLWAEVVSILLAAALAVSVREGGRRDAVEAAGSIRAVVRHHREVLLGWVARGTGCALWFAFTLGLVLLGHEQGRGGELLAVGMAAYGVGSVAGTLAALPLLRVVRTLPAMAGAWTLTGGCWVLMGSVPQAVPVALAAAASGLAVSVGNTAGTAQITRGSDGSSRRTLMTGQNVVVNAASSLGLLVGGPVLALVGAANTLRGAGAVCSLVAVTCLFLRRAQAASGEPGGDVRGAGAVAAAEQAGVHEQRMELVDADAVGPAVGER